MYMFVLDYKWSLLNLWLRDLLGATPKDRLSKDEENYQEILDLLDKKSEPILQDYIIKVSVIKYAVLFSGSERLWQHFK